MNDSLLRNSVRAAVGLSACATLIAGLVVAPAGAQAPQPPAQCPQAIPVSEVREGDTGTGFTPEDSATPVSFGAEVLGVLPDAILPGRDLVVIEMSGPPINRSGGIWFGMSGSPVFIGNRLLGAVAYGFSFGASPLAGVTLAEDMLDILEYPKPDPDDASARRPAQRIRLPKSMIRTIVRRTDVSRKQAARGLRQLKLPLSASGIGTQRLDALQEVIEKEKLPLFPVAGSSVSQAQGPGGQLQTGGPIGASLSFGDVTFGASGTTTLVCEGAAVAFGHPFFFNGETNMGANLTEPLTVVKDPTFGPFRLDRFGEIVGTVDQDRFAGIRAQTGDAPDTTPITSFVEALDTDRSRDGRTEVIQQELFPFIAFAHMFSNVDSIYDQIAGGSSSVSWTVTGTTESGVTWDLTRDNIFASEFDISFGSFFELERFLVSLFNNKFEEIEFTGLDATATLSEEIDKYRIRGVQTSVDGGPLKKRRRIVVDRGDVIVVRVTLEPSDDPETKTFVDLSLQVPRDAKRRGFLTVTGFGGRRGNFCFFEIERCAASFGTKIEDFDDLIAALENMPKNDELIAQLFMSKGRAASSTAESVQDRVVAGARFIEVRLRGAGKGRRGGKNGEVVID